jgi:energy-coupling factor transport system permease protein
MESRCYNGGENRTKLRQLKYTRKDLYAAVIFAAASAAVIFAGNLQ